VLCEPGDVQVADVETVSANVDLLIHVDRSGGETLGVDLDVEASQGSARVTSINPGGLVAAWNFAHPDLMVLAGDVFTAVNNKSDELIKRLSAKTSITIEVQR